MSNSCRVAQSDLILSLKSHNCSLCEKCLVCHQCLLARGYLRGGTRKPIGTTPSTDTQINAILDAMLTNQDEGEPPRYILVGPNNEIVESAPSIEPAHPQRKPLTVKTLVNGVEPTYDDSDSDDQENEADGIDTPSFYECDVCDKTFTFKRDLNIHQKSHTIEEVQECTICHATFKNSCELLNHTLDCTVIEPPCFLECGVCEKTFTSERDFNVHQIYHAMDEVHECKICNVTFKYSYELIKHSLYHDAVKTFTCEYCKRSYNSEEALKIHLRVHTGSRPFVCEICDRAFKENFSLKKHLMIHTDERPFACDVCGRSFRDKLKLERHNWIHEGIKPFSCLICEKAFRHKCNLKSHLLKHHNMGADNVVVEEEVEV